MTQTRTVLARTLTPSDGKGHKAFVSGERGELRAVSLTIGTVPATWWVPSHYRSAEASHQARKSSSWGRCVFAEWVKEGMMDEGRSRDRGTLTSTA